MNGKARDREKGAELIETAFVLLLFGNLIAGGNYSRRTQFKSTAPPHR
jgi:hypothetical protein